LTKDNGLTVLADRTQATGRQAFSLEEMVTCSECLRPNPPTRNACFYCAAPLPLSSGIDKHQQPGQIPGQSTQRGYSVVLLPQGDIALTDNGLSEVASLLRFRVDELTALLSRRQPLPLAYVTSVEAANQRKDRLSALGLNALIIADEDLEHVPSPKKIRALELSEDSLAGVATNDRKKIAVRWDEIVLIVAGRVIVKRVEVEQPKSRRNQRPAESRELSHDDAVLDIYTSARDGGWRITARSFDFSCLEEKKSVLAVENIGVLADSLKERANHAHFYDLHARVRRALAAIWPVEVQTESSGWRRAGASKYTMTTTNIHDNEAQFTRYSRLCHYLRLRALEKSE